MIYELATLPPARLGRDLTGVGGHGKREQGAGAAHPAGVGRGGHGGRGHAALQGGMMFRRMLRNCYGYLGPPTR